MECIEDIDIDAKLNDAYLHRRLPAGVQGTQTTLYHHDKRCQKQTTCEDSPPQLSNRGAEDECSSDEEEGDPTRLVVACPRPVIVASEEPKGTPFPIQNMPNYITQDDSPAENTRSKTRRQETIMRMSDEVMLSCI